MKQHNCATRTGILFLQSILILALAWGCSNTGVKNKLGRVSGKVTLGGAPLPNALVTFSGIQGGSPSMGRTDASGTYTLIFSRNINGAEVGSHTVTFSTYQPETDDPPQAEVPEKVPLKYREGDAMLKAEVKSGSNTLNFDLESGPVEAPQPKDKGKGKAKPKGPVLCY